MRINLNLKKLTILKIEFIITEENCLKNENIMQKVQPLIRMEPTKLKK